MAFNLLGEETTRMILSFIGGEMNTCFLTFKDEPENGGGWRRIVVSEDLSISRDRRTCEPELDEIAFPPVSNLGSLRMMKMLAVLAFELRDDDGVGFTPGPDGFEELRLTVTTESKQEDSSLVTEYFCHRDEDVVGFEIKDIFSAQPVHCSKLGMKKTEKLRSAILKADYMVPEVCGGTVGNFLLFRSTGIPSTAYAASVAMSTRRSLRPLRGPFVELTEAGHITRAYIPHARLTVSLPDP